MKQSKLEPGILQILKTLAIFQVFGILFVRRTIGTALGIELPLVRWLAFTLTVPLLLVGFTWIAWFHQKLGRVYLPLCLAIAGINLIGDKYLTISLFTPPAQQELQLLLLVINLWLNMLLILVVVAWQYSARWVLFVSLAFSAADVVLSLPFMKPGTSFFSVTLVLFLARLVTVTFVGLVVQWLANRQRVQRLALAEANRKLVHYAAATEQLAVSQERNRLARELHDTLAHSLSGATVQLEAVQALWDVKPGEARLMLDHALEVTQNGLTEARRALHALRSSQLDDLGLALAVSEMAKSSAARANLHLDLDVQNHIENLAPEVEQCVYRVAQETLTNVARHADAKTLHISLWHDSTSLTLIITDDGHGFDPAAVDGAHYGLQGLRERAEMIGATLRVSSTLQEGTTIRLVVPMLEAGL